MCYRSLRVIQTGIIRKLACGTVSCISFEIQRYIGRKSWFFFLPPLHSTPPLGCPHRNVSIPFGVQNYSRMVGLPDGEKKFENICNCLDTIPACDRQADRRTDRQTSCHGIVRDMHTRRAVKTNDSGNWNIILKQ